MKTILIDFNITSDKELKLIAKSTTISYDYLVDLRDNHSIEKVFIDMDQKKVLAYVYSHIDGVHYFDDVFLSMKPFKVEIPVEVILDTDTILEKISTFGIDSLTDDEKNYLDNLSK
jgi:hypothetical protein